MEKPEDHIKNVLEIIGQPGNLSEINYQIHLKSQLDKIDSRFDVCKGCLTSFSLGQFKIEQIKPSNHLRRQKRQHKIDSLQKSLKSDTSAGSKTGKELRKLRRQIEHLQDINNHVMIYKCQICHTSSSVRLWKPKSKPNNQRKQTPRDDSPKQITNEQSNFSGNKTPKSSKKKRNKTAGLTIPSASSNTTTTTPTSAAAARSRHKNFASISKLLSSSSLQQQQSTAKSKLNQFLK